MYLNSDSYLTVPHNSITPPIFINEECGCRWLWTCSRPWGWEGLALSPHRGHDYWHSREGNKQYGYNVVTSSDLDRCWERHWDPRQRTWHIAKDLSDKRIPVETPVANLCQAAIPGGTERLWGSHPACHCLQHLHLTERQPGTRGVSPDFVRLGLNLPSSKVTSQNSPKHSRCPSTALFP